MNDTAQFPPIPPERPPGQPRLPQPGPQQPQMMPVPYGHYGQLPGFPLPPPATPAGGGGRSTGFWIALTAAVATGIVIALLGGFFIARGSRLSNGDVQDKLNQQAQADQVRSQQSLEQQKNEMMARRDRIVARAEKKARSEGRSQGRSQGQQEGFQNGQSSGFSQGQSSGYAQGQSDGLSQGLSSASCLVDDFFC